MAAHVTQSDKKKKGPKLTTTPHKKKTIIWEYMKKESPAGGSNPQP